MVFKNTHPPIIDEATWEVVRKTRQNKRRPIKYGLPGLFIGTLFCSDCGNKLYFHTAKVGEKLIGSYSCSEYRKIKKRCTAHYITEKSLEEAVLTHLRLIISIALDDEHKFAESMMDKSRRDVEKGLDEKKKILRKHRQRAHEIDSLFERLYMDNVNGKITDERFEKMSGNFEQEQTGLKETVEALEKEIANQENQAINVDRFLVMAREVAEVKELTPAIVNRFIQRILVHDPEVPRARKNRDQRIEIVYNFIGQFEMGNMEESA